MDVQGSARTRLGGMAVAIVGTAACGPAVWAALSLLPTGVDPATADHLIEPPRLSDAARATIAGLAATVAGAAGALLAARSRRRPPSPWSVLAVLALGAVWAYAGLTFAAATAPTVGANIGAGILLLGGVVLIPLGLIVAVVAALLARRRHPAAAGAPPVEHDPA